MSGKELVSIVVPVFNRDKELRRALESIKNQSYSNFECLIVDDCSSIDIGAIVQEYDDRFVYLRTDRNSGCTGARYFGYARASGSVVSQLDSDNELLPSALAHGLQVLAANPSVAGVSGQYKFSRRRQISLGAPQVIVTPESFARGEIRGGDMVPLMRQHAVDEWLAKDDRYFNTDFHIWLTYHLQHQHLYVQDVWGIFHDDADGRISKSVDPRNISDLEIFVKEHRRIIGDAACLPLDEFLMARWNRIRHTNGSARQALEEWMLERGISKAAALRAALTQKVLRSWDRITSRRNPAVQSES